MIAGRLTCTQSLDLALIGNSCAAALVDGNARIVWWCSPTSISIRSLLATPGRGGIVTSAKNSGSSMRPAPLSSSASH